MGLGKRMARVLLAACLTVGLMPAVALAAEPTQYTIWVSGVQVTSDNAADVLGDATTDKPASVTYEASSNTLTLRNAGLEGVASAPLDGSKSATPFGAALYAEGDLTVALEGENAAIGAVSKENGVTSAGVRVTGVLTLHATSAEDSTLVAIGQDMTDMAAQSLGVHANDVVLNDGVTLIAEGGTSTGNFGVSIGVHAENSVQVKGGTLTASAKDAALNSWGIQANGSGVAVDISGNATVDATAGAASAYSEGIVAAQGSIAINTSASVSATGGTSSGTGSNSASHGMLAGAVITVQNGTVTAGAGESKSELGSVGMSASTINLTGGTITATSTGTGTVAQAMNPAPDTSGYDSVQITASTNPDGTSPVDYNANNIGSYRYLNVAKGTTPPSPEPPPTPTPTDHSHNACGLTTCNHEGHTTISYDKVLATDTTSITESGNYRLDSDTKLENTLTISGVDTVVHLCLNGHALSSASGGVIKVTNGVTLVVCDCQGNGKITGGSGTYGGGVQVIDHATFEMYGGTISDNKASSRGGGLFCQSSTCTLNGVTITGNSASQKGGGVYVVGTSTFTLAGDTNISGNSISSGSASSDSDVHLGTDKVITIGDGFTTSKPISVVTENVPAADKLVPITSVVSGDYSSSFVYGGEGASNVEVRSIGAEVREQQVVLAPKKSAHAHRECGFDNCQHEGHETINYLPWDGTTIYPGGNVYLTKDVEIEGTVVLWSGSLCLNGHTLTRVAEGNGSVLYVVSYQDASLCDCKGNGKVTGGNVSGIIAADKSNFTLYGGSIVGNAASLGGGVRVSTNATFTMRGGSIVDNVATTRGGGVHIDDAATFVMYGGSIAGNTAESGLMEGGGVFVSLNATFTMRGGNITNNATAYGGGVYLDREVQHIFASFSMEGGSITNNYAAEQGGGVWDDSLFAVSGSSVIADNYLGDRDARMGVNNVYLKAQRVIAVSAPLTTGTANIGVTAEETPTETSPVVITDENGASSVGCFTSDAGLRVSTQDGAVVLRQSTAHVDHPLCGATCTHDGEHATVVFKPWDGKSALENNGCYYLTSNVERDRIVPILRNCTVTLCLNGYSIVNDGSTPAMSLYPGATLNLCNCQEYGTITGGSCGIEMQKDSTLTFFGGTVTGNKSSGSSSAGGISVDEGATLNLRGGNVKNNVGTVAGGVYAKGQVNYWAGDITGNTLLDGTVNNLFVPKGAVIDAWGTHSTFGTVGITAEEASDRVFIARGLPNNEGVPSGWTSDNAQYYLENSGTACYAALRNTLSAPTNLAWAENGQATWSAIEGNSGYRVRLYKNGTADTNMVVTYTVAAGTTSFNFQEQIQYCGAGTYYFSVQAQGAANTPYVDSAWSEPSAGYSNVVATPTFTPTAGTYTGSQRVTIACATEGATIYYTTDGTDPTAESTRYTGPFTVSASSTIKALAVKDGMFGSSVAQVDYIINASGTQSGAIYEVIEGADGVWSSGTISDNGQVSNLVFRVNADFSKFTNVVQVDGIALTANDYLAWPGSTYVSLKTSYLQTLNPGVHTLRVNFTDGYAETTFTIEGSTTSTGGAKLASTGDSAQAATGVAGVLAACAACVVVGGCVAKRRRNAGR